MALAYSAIANGGRVVRPHLGLQVENALGNVEQRIETRVQRHLKIAETNRQAVLEGLRLAASAPGGTSVDVFRGFPRTVYG